MARKDKHYDDALEEVMSYAVLQLDKEGVRATVRNEKEMRGLLQWLNDREREKGNTGRFDSSFIEGAITSRTAKIAYGGGRIVADDPKLNYGLPLRTTIVKGGVLGRFGGVIKRFIMGEPRLVKDRDADLRTYITPQAPGPQAIAPTYREQKIIVQGRERTVVRDARGRFTRK